MGETENDPLSAEVIGAAIEVHQTLGPGLLESVYEDCLCRELAERSVPFVRQLEVPIRYKQVTLATKLRLDLIIDHKLIIEVKSVERLEPLHKAQLHTYLKLLNVSAGLLLNFNVPMMRDGIKRVVLAK